MNHHAMLANIGHQLGMCWDEDAPSGEGHSLPTTVSAEKSPRPKRQRRSIEDDLICPISLELPFDPVTAEDGRIYERLAIERYFGTKRDDGLVPSPLSGEWIGKRLMASPQIKNVIEVSIENGAISADLAAKWTQRRKEHEYLQDLRAKAKQGDPEAMRALGLHYRYGKYGLVQNYRIAYSWMEKAHQAGSTRGTAALGEMLVKGYGVAKNIEKGAMYLTLAAGKGSSYAAYWLGMALAEGKFGMEVDCAEAMHWLKEALSGKCLTNNLTERGAIKARQKLQELLMMS